MFDLGPTTIGDLPRRPPDFFALLVPAVLTLAVFAAGCGSETTAVSVDGVGRAASSDDTVAEVAPVIEGLIDCDDVPLLTPEETETPIAALSLDQQVVSVLADYGSANPESFAGLWLDARFGGAPIVSFSGDLAAHRQAIMRQLGAEGGPAPFGMASALRSERDLTEAIETIAELAADNGIASHRSASVDSTRNRVVLDLLDPTESELERLLELLGSDLACLDVTISPPRPEGPLDVLPRGGGQELLSCGDFPFPAAALADPIPIRSVDHPAATLVARSTGDATQEPGSDTEERPAAIGEWIALDIGSGRAYFGRYDGGVEATVAVELDGSQWAITGWAFGCELRVGLPIGLGEVEIFRNPGDPISSSDRSFTVLVTELACAGGEEMGQRLLGPQVIEDDEQILLAFAAVTNPQERSECPGNPLTEITVELAQPVGARTIVDGMRIPPKPLGTP